MNLSFTKQLASYCGMIIPYVKKWIYPQKKFLNDIQITTGGSYTIDCFLNDTQPHIQVFLQVFNLSQYLDVEIDSIILEQLIIKSDICPCIAQHKDKKIGEKINRKSFINLCFAIELSLEQVKVLSNIKKPYNIEASLFATIFIESSPSLYKDKIKIHLESVPCRLYMSNPNLSTS